MALNDYEDDDDDDNDGGMMEAVVGSVIERLLQMHEMEAEAEGYNTRDCLYCGYDVQHSGFWHSNH